MKFKNEDIYKIGSQLNSLFNDNDVYLPTKVNFPIQRNKKTFLTLAQEIEESRMGVIRYYGVPAEDGETYTIPPDVIEQASKELEDLINIEQEVSFSKVKLEDLENIKFTSAQMDALMFMIEE